MRFQTNSAGYLNLLINASEAMEQGGTPYGRGRGYFHFGKMVKIEIIDTGHGISQGAIWAGYFEPFFTTKGEGKGVGLGLAVVYGIITRHGGTIEATSEGQGLHVHHSFTDRNPGQTEIMMGGRHGEENPNPGR